ncbi:MAG: NnrS family protein [Hyphomicrobiales bacterium]|nr:NnrS family protein [Hyphomicrobiales bacterium]
MSIPAALARRRDYSGPALFSYGFRPFFLGAALWSGLAVLLWVPRYFGEISLPTAMSPLDWHSHEMLYGYVAAAISGFLLTAIPNWTGRLPVCGLPLAALALTWLAGRIAILASARIGQGPAALIDIAFLVVLAGLALREIVAGRNWRNLRVLGVLAVLIAGNIVWHAELLRGGAGVYGPRIAIAAVIGMITLVGGRIVPSFTRNWLVRNNPGRLPTPFSRFDAVALAGGALALAAWVVIGDHPLVGAALLLGGVLHLVRLARWAGDRTLADRLVLVLHVAYAFVPLGFLLLGAAMLWPQAIAESAGIHAWTAGAAGMMTLAVMTRASLGHTGRPLIATPATQAIYLCGFLAVCLRLLAALGGWPSLLHVAGLAWVATFLGYAAVYGPLLIARPPVWSQGH